MKEPLVIGHRGAMGHETENTLASIQKALDLGVDMIEIDVFKIASGETVVFHDETVDRLTNGGGSIEKYDIDELRKLIVEGNHKIPLLEDVLELIDKKVRLNIELKGVGTAVSSYRIIEEHIKENGWTLNNFLISSFRWNELEKIRELNDEIPIALLTEESPVEAIHIAKKLRAEAISPNYWQLDRKKVRKIKEEGFKIYVWTINRQKHISRMKRYAVDGIITNYPERVN